MSVAENWGIKVGISGITFLWAFLTEAILINFGGFWEVTEGLSADKVWDGIYIDGMLVDVIGVDAKNVEAICFGDCIGIEDGLGSGRSPNCIRNDGCTDRESDNCCGIAEDSEGVLSTVTFARLAIKLRACIELKVIDGLFVKRDSSKLPISPTILNRSSSPSHIAKLNESEGGIPELF